MPTKMCYQKNMIFKGKFLRFSKNFCSFLIKNVTLQFNFYI